MAIDQFLDQLLILIRLKSIRRTGWVETNIRNPESVADHSFNVAILALLLGDEENVDRTKVLKMALVHDLAEAIIGDMVWQRGQFVDVKLKKEKDVLEMQAIEEILNSIDDKVTKSRFKEIRDLMQEYIEQNSIESQLVKELDKLEMCIQALAYYQDSPFEEITSFLDSARDYVHTEQGKNLFNEIERRIIELGL
ncbi:MAG: HD family hydrolase [Methanobacteriota archaeon]|nr:MAG: HD family hydrolase [Euryarchaeota archaeon]